MEFEHSYSDNDPQSRNYRWCEICQKIIPDRSGICPKSKQEVLVIYLIRTLEYILNHGYYVECAEPGTPTVRHWILRRRPEN